MIFFVRYLSLLFLFDNGNFMILFFISSDNGVNGNIYDLPNVFMLHIFVVNIMNTINIPNIPMVVPPIMNSNRYHFMAFVNSGSVTINALMAVTATTIIIIGETIPAFTAASPNINAPTMDRAELDMFGIR